MKTLSFERAVRETIAGRCIRGGRFEERSLLPLGAACVVASNVRERLTGTFGAPVSLRLLEPRIPCSDSWQRILRRARTYQLRGPVTEAAIILRPRDLLAIAAAAFGEPVARPADERSLSPIESAVVERTVRGLSGAFAALCGETPESRGEMAPQAAAFSTYFELILESPVEARIGVAVAREPAPEACQTLQPADLDTVRVPVRAGIELGSMTAGALSALAVGDLLPIIPPRALRGSLRIAGRRLAGGTCGVRNGRYALEIEGS